MKLFAAMLPGYAFGALAFVAVAHGSHQRSGNATGHASSSAQTYCAGLQQEISAQTFEFSGWRCKQGPGLRGHDTILSWVTMTSTGGKAHVELVWVVETQPVQDAQVIDARNVPGYGYEPSDVKQAYRMPTEAHGPA